MVFKYGQEGKEDAGIITEMLTGERLEANSAETVSFGHIGRRVTTLGVPFRN